MPLTLDTACLARVAAAADAGEEVIAVPEESALSRAFNRIKEGSLAMRIALIAGALIVLALVLALLGALVGCIVQKARRKAKWDAVKREGEAADRAEKQRKEEDEKRNAWLAKYSDATLVQGQPWERLKQHAMKDGFEVSYWFVSSLCRVKNCLEYARRGGPGPCPAAGQVPESTGGHGSAEVPSRQREMEQGACPGSGDRQSHRARE